MLLAISCRQGTLQLTEDWYLQVSSMVSSQSWREPVGAIRGFSFKPGMLGSCGFIVYGEQAHLVTMVVRKDFDHLCQLLPAVPVTQVPDLQLTPAPAPLFSQPELYLAPAPPAPVSPVRPTLDIPCAGNRLQITEHGYLQMVRPFGSIVWSVLARQVTGIRSKRKFPALTVTIDTTGGSYTAEMVSNQDFEKLRAAIAAYQ